MIFPLSLRAGTDKRNVVCRNITICKNDELPAPECAFDGYDADHTIERVRIENVTLNAEPFIPQTRCNAFTDEITADSGTTHR